MRKVNIREAKTQLSKLISTGEEVIIVRHGEPVARLVPIRTRREKGVHIRSNQDFDSLRINRCLFL